MSQAATDIRLETKDETLFDSMILPKCDSFTAFRSIHSLLREAGKSTKIIALIETAKGVSALDEIVSDTIRHCQHTGS